MLYFRFFHRPHALPCPEKGPNMFKCFSPLSLSHVALWL